METADQYSSFFRFLEMILSENSTALFPENFLKFLNHLRIIGIVIQETSTLACLATTSLTSPYFNIPHFSILRHTSLPLTMTYITLKRGICLQVYFDNCAMTFYTTKGVSRRAFNFFGYF